MAFRIPPQKYFQWKCRACHGRFFHPTKVKEQSSQNLGGGGVLDAIHPSLTIARVAEAAERHLTTLDNPGFCIACGKEADGCEVDAEYHECESCGEHAVFGASELLFYLGQGF
jgi:hypothetical protein